MYEINEMLLRRKNKVNLPKRSVEHEAGRAEKAMAVSIVKNVESLGFTFDKELFENLLTYPKNEIEMFYTDFIAKLKPLVGADKEYNPMYPNFPRQVAEASDAELFINAILHYRFRNKSSISSPKYCIKIILNQNADIVRSVIEGIRCTSYLDSDTDYYFLANIMLKHLRECEEGCHKISQLAINGNDMKSIGLEGKAIGEMLESLLLAVFAEEVSNTYDDLKIDIFFMNIIVVIMDISLNIMKCTFVPNAADNFLRGIK